MDKICPCHKKSCPRHGDCEACRKYHSNKKRPPYCERKSLLKKLTKK